MLNIVGIFKNRVLDIPRLLQFGFVQADEIYTISYRILNGLFQMDVMIAVTGAVSVKVLDTDSREEYILVHTLTASGAFVGSVIQACEEKLELIAEHCFNYTVFKSEQAMQIIEYANKTHQDHLEFLWKKFPGNAVFRCKDSGKWYAAILTVAKAKLGLLGNEAVEIIDLRALPDDVAQLIDCKKYFPGYHMNKKHWYTICLDGSVSTQEIYARIETSYLLVQK